MTSETARPNDVEWRLRRILTEDYQSAVTRGDLVEVILLIHKALEDALDARLGDEARRLSFAAKARRAVPAWVDELEQLDKRRRAIAHPNVLLHRTVARLAEDYVTLVLRRWLILVGGDDPPPAVTAPVAVRRRTPRPAAAPPDASSLFFEDVPTAPLRPGQVAGRATRVDTAPLRPGPAAGLPAGVDTAPLPELRPVMPVAAVAAVAPPAPAPRRMPSLPWPLLLLGFAAGLVALALLGAAGALGDELAARDLWALPVVALALVFAGAVAVLALGRAARASGPLPAAGVAVLLAVLVVIPSAVDSAAPLSPLTFGRQAASRLATAPAPDAPRGNEGVGGLPPAPTFTPRQFDATPSPPPSSSSPAAPVAAGPPESAPAAETAGIRAGGLARVSTEEGARLNARAEPTLDAEVLAVFEPGEVLTVVSGPVRAEGRDWWRVAGAAGEGWCAAEFLAPAP